jgi:hypothetical protein
MKRWYVLYLLVCAVVLPLGTTVAQDLLFSTPSSEVFISSGGRLVLDNRTTSRGMSRWAFLNFGISKTSVYNFDDSIHTIQAAVVDSTSLNRKADYVIKHIASPAEGTLGPTPFSSSLHHIMWAYLWKDLKGIVVGYRLKNVGSSSMTGKLSFELYPRIDQSYGGHSLRWRTQDSIAFYFRSGAAHYVGAKYLSGNPTGVKLSTGAMFYQPGVSAAESQLDSIRYSASQYTGFDVSVDSGGTTSTPRSMIHINTGNVTIPAGDSTQWVYYAIAYDTSEVKMLQALTDVIARSKSLLTSVEQIGTQIPITHALLQNYPNPFNPTTVVSYQLPAFSEVRLGVYDLLGRELAILVNERQEAGRYQVTFNAAGLAGGVYFYRLQSGTFQETRRMMLVK